MLKKSLFGFGFLKGEEKTGMRVAAQDNIVDAEIIEAPTNKPAEYDLQEVLTFYMEQSRVLEEQLNDAKKKNGSLEKKVSDMSALLNEKDVENAALKTTNASLKRKVTMMEKKVTRLTAIEKVWKETFSKLNIVSGSVAPAMATEIGSVTVAEEETKSENTNNEATNMSALNTAFGPIYFHNEELEECVVEE